MPTFNKRDWDLISEYIIDEHRSRKRARVTHEKIWKDIDRQLRMDPDTRHKLDAHGRPDQNKAWMPETELPLQAQTLEVLTSDARRMKFPDSGLWFSASALVTDEYLDRVDLSSLIAGDENDVPSEISQDNVDKIVQGVVSYWTSLYKFQDHIDQIDAESFKYSMGIGRVREVSMRIFSNTDEGVIKTEQKVPIIFPRSIKDVYLDNSKHHLMNEGEFIGPSVIAHKFQKIKDLQIAAQRGGNNPNDMSGGWMPKNLKGMEGDKKKEVEVIEYEGDLIVPRKSGDSIFIPDALVTVAIGLKGEKTMQSVIRFRFNKYASYIEFPYHKEHIDDAYGTSPLMKGWPIQVAAVDALNKLLMSGALNTLPPVSYSPDDMYFGKNGVNIHPGANWPTTDGIVTHQIGDPSSMFAIYAGLLQQYADVTGVNAPRLGAQTVSHTTAFAKEAELSRGTVRTVDYVRSTLNGPMTQFLQTMYKIGRNNLSEKNIYIESYGGFVTVDKDTLPEEVVFKAHGSGGPSEEQVKMQNRLQSLQLALSIEQLRAQAQQLGTDTVVNFERTIREVLRQGGWTDVDAITNSLSEGSDAAPNLAGDTGQNLAPGAALQAFSQQ